MNLNDLRAVGSAPAEQGVRTHQHAGQLEAGLWTTGGDLNRDALEASGVSGHHEHAHSPVFKASRHQSDVGVETARDQHLGAVEDEVAVVGAGHRCRLGR